MNLVLYATDFKAANYEESIIFSKQNNVLYLIKEGKFVYLTTPLEHIDFPSVNHMVIVTYFCRGNPMSHYRPILPISSKDFIYALSHRLVSTYQSL